MINNKPDEIDLHIMAILQRDALVNMNALGKMVFRSPAAVSERVQRLRDMGYIKGYTAILDRELSGLPVLVVVQVKLRNQTSAALLEYERRVCGLVHVQSCMHVSGDWDFIINVTAATPQAYYVFLMEEIAGDSVAQVESNFVMRESKSHSPLALAGVNIVL